MMNDEQPVELPEEKARAGATPHIVRYVLLASLILVVIAFAIILAIGFRPG